MFTLNCRGRLLTIDRPVVMGIINSTPDSFFADSRQQSVNAALRQAEKMLNDGAAMLDIGGQSTRPGSTQVTAAEELARIENIIPAIHNRFPEAVISVDTYYASVARMAVQAGAAIVNDISGGMLDEAMLTTVAGLKAVYICMHMKGNPQTMQQHTQYEDVTRDVLDYFIERTEDCRLAGINDVIVDPGIGFSKTIQQNFELIKNLATLRMLQKPLLLGVSRKGTIYKTLGITADEALNGTTVLHTIGLLNGANILRVHDVKEAVEAIKLVDACAFAG
ncbi:dihydropteroate synthase [Foetidibacter luteolus]|uniref:dihydropteroate synthase n=1 Tax=Foetidibacter luteolus TaxID=2608880 RepID=UPI00129A7B94|nr:dihydropteroate synthase [Foetidibacter luteolus]